MREGDAIGCRDCASLRRACASSNVQTDKNQPICTSCYMKRMKKIMDSTPRNKKGDK